MPSIKPFKALIRVPALMVLGISLAGCASTSFVSMQGAGQAFPRAQYVVKGKTAYDQTWIDKTIEAEVKGFGFKRPLKRPASLDQQTVTVTPAKPQLLAPTEPAVVTVVPKKLHWWQRKRHEP